MASTSKTTGRKTAVKTAVKPVGNEENSMGDVTVDKGKMEAIEALRARIDSGDAYTARTAEAVRLAELEVERLNKLAVEASAKAVDNPGDEGAFEGAVTAQNAWRKAVEDLERARVEHGEAEATKKAAEARKTAEDTSMVMDPGQVCKDENFVGILAPVFQFKRGKSGRVSVSSVCRIYASETANTIVFRELRGEKETDEAMNLEQFRRMLRLYVFDPDPKKARCKGNGDVYLSGICDALKRHAQKDKDGNTVEVITGPKIWTGMARRSDGGKVWAVGTLRVTSGFHPETGARMHEVTENTEYALTQEVWEALGLESEAYVF